MKEKDEILQRQEELRQKEKLLNQKEQQLIQEQQRKVAQKSSPTKEESSALIVNEEEKAQPIAANYTMANMVQSINSSYQSIQESLPTIPPVSVPNLMNDVFSFFGGRRV